MKKIIIYIIYNFVTSGKIKEIILYEITKRFLIRYLN